MGFRRQSRCWSRQRQLQHALHVNTSRIVENTSYILPLTDMVITTYLRRHAAITVQRQNIIIQWWFSLLVTKLSVKHVTCHMGIHNFYAWKITGICCYMFEMNQMLPLFFVCWMRLPPDADATGSGCLVPGIKIVEKLSRQRCTINCMINGANKQSAWIGGAQHEYYIQMGNKLLFWLFGPSTAHTHVHAHMHKHTHTHTCACTLAHTYIMYIYTCACKHAHTNTGMSTTETVSREDHCLLTLFY